MPANSRWDLIRRLRVKEDEIRGKNFGRKPKGKLGMDVRVKIKVESKVKV